MTEAGLIIAARLREGRRKSGLTQVEVEKALNYKSSSLSQIENGQKSPQAIDIPTFAKLYNVSLGWLFGINESGSEYTKEEIELLKSFREATNRDKEIAKRLLRSDPFEQTS